MTRMGPGTCPRCGGDTLWLDGMHSCKECGQVRGPVDGSEEWEEPVLYDKKEYGDKAGQTGGDTIGRSTVYVKPRPIRLTAT